MAVNTHPIWLGSSTTHEVVAVKPIRQVVPPDMHGDEFVLTIERMEGQASQYEGAKKYVQAAECLEQAINRRLGFLGEKHPELLLAIERHVCNCNYWGIQCLNARHYSAALELLKKAQAMTEAELVPNFKRRVYLRAVTFNNLCCYFHARGKLNAALQCVDRALKIEQRYKDSKNTARTHLNLGVLLSLMMRHDEAMEHSECAIAFLQDQEQSILHQHGLEGVYGEGADPALRARYEEVISSLVVAYHNTGVECTKTGHHDQALDFLNHANQISEQKLGPQNPFTIVVNGTLDVTARAHPPSPMRPQRSHMLAIERTETLLKPPSQDSKNVTAASLPVEQPTSQASDMLPAIGSPGVPQKPRSACTPRQKKMRGMRAMEQIKGGGNPINLLIPPELLNVRPRLGDSIKKNKAASAHVGSPIIQQTVHGVIPMSTLYPPPEGDKGLHSSHSSTKSHKPKARAPGYGQIPETSISGELPDGFTLPQIIAHYKEEMLKDGADTVYIKPDEQRVQAIAALRGQILRTQAEYPAMTSAAQREDKELNSTGIEDSTRGLAVRVVSAAKPAMVEYEAAAAIQRVVRGVIARRQILREVSRVANRAATRLQRLFRRVRDARIAASISDEAATRPGL